MMRRVLTRSQARVHLSEDGAFSRPLYGSAQTFIGTTLCRANAISARVGDGDYLPISLASYSPDVFIPAKEPPLCKHCRRAAIVRATYMIQIAIGKKLSDSGPIFNSVSVLIRDE